MGLEDKQSNDACLSLASRLVARCNQLTLLLGIQIVLILCVGIVYLVMFGWPEALAVVYGGGMAIFTIWMLVMRTRLAKKIAEDMPNQEVRVLYVGAIQRFASMLVLFVVGMAILRLDPVSLLSGFVVSLAGGVLGAYLYVLYFGVR